MSKAGGHGDSFIILQANLFIKCSRIDFKKYIYLLLLTKFTEAIFL